MGEFDGEVAIVTGAGRGIGRQIALDWAQEGARIVCAARSKDQIASVVDEIESSGGQALAHPCDVRSAAELERLVAASVDHFGGINLVANNAGAGGAMLTLESSEAEILDVDGGLIMGKSPLALSRLAGTE